MYLTLYDNKRKVWADPFSVNRIYESYNATNYNTRICIMDITENIDVIESFDYVMEQMVKFYLEYNNQKTIPDNFYKELFETTTFTLADSDSIVWIKPNLIKFFFGMGSPNGKTAIKIYDRKDMTIEVSENFEEVSQKLERSKSMIKVLRKLQKYEKRQNIQNKNELPDKSEFSDSHSNHNDLSNGGFIGEVMNVDNLGLSLLIPGDCETKITGTSSDYNEK